jgi:hypothetical protein
MILEYHMELFNPFARFIISILIISNSKNSRIVRYTLLTSLLFASFAYTTIIPAQVENYNLMLGTLLLINIVIRHMAIFLNLPIIVILIITSFMYLANIEVIDYHFFIMYILSIQVIVLLSTTNKTDIRSFIVLYVYMIFMISIGSLVSFVLVNFFNLQTCDQTIYIYEGIEVDVDQIWQRKYYWPCYLGLVEFTDIETYYRASGISYEPIQAGTFMGPALLLVSYCKISSQILSRLIKVTIFVSLILAIQSLTIIFGLCSIFIIQKLFIRANSILILSFTLIFILALLGAFGHSLIKLIADLYLQDGIPLPIRKLLNNKYYFDQLLIFSIPVGLSVFAIAWKNSTFHKNGNTLQSAMLMIIVFHLFYIFKDHINDIFVFSTIFYDLSFMIWLGIFAVSISHRFSRNIYFRSHRYSR